MLSSLPVGDIHDIHLYYLTKNEGDSVLDPKIRSIIDSNSLEHISYVPHYSDTAGRLSAKDVIDSVAGRKAVFHICGPKGMMDDFVKELTRAGIKRSDIISEDFELT